MIGAFFGFFCLFCWLWAFTKSKSAGVFTFCLIYPFLPRYVAFSLGSENFALSFKRILLFVFLTLILAQYLFIKRCATVKKDDQSYVALYLLIIVVSSISSIFHYRGWYGYLSALETLALLVIGLYSSKVMLSDFNFKKFISVLFVYPLLIIIPVALVEFVGNVSLFFELFGDGNVSADLGGKAYRVRDGMVRAQASFDGPLQLSEYILFSLPGLFFLLSQSRRKSYYVLIVAALLTITLTGSRGGMGLAVMVLLFHSIARSALVTSNVRRIFVLGMVGLPFIFGFLALWYHLSQFVFIESFALIDSAAERSSYSRLLQYFVVPTLLEGNIFWGLGYARNFVTLFNLHALDNYYLWLMLESGLIGVFCFCVFLILSIKKSGDLLSSKRSSESKMLGLMFIEFFLIFSINKAFLQSPANLIYLFLFVSALSVARKRFLRTLN